MVKMNIFNAVADTEKFEFNICRHYRPVNGVIVVYDVTSRESFNMVEKWMNYGIGICASTDITIILVANKSDLESAFILE